MSNYHFSFNRKKGVYEKRPCKAKSPNRCPFSKESVEVSSFERELHKAGLSKVSETFINQPRTLLTLVVRGSKKECLIKASV